MSYVGNQPSTSAFLTDSFNGTGSQTAFTLSAAPANTASILVAISGVLQDPSTYSLVGTTLNFSAAPPSATGNISIRYLGIPAAGVVNTAYRTVTEYTATANQTTFTPPSYTVGFINVFRNGVLLGSADYTANNGTTVVLASGATAGDLIAIESFYVASFVNAIQAVPGAVNNGYLGAGSVTSDKLAALSTIPSSAGNITVPAATGTVMVSGNMPAFSVYRGSSSQSISATTLTKVQLNTEEFDTANAFDSTTNYRFTPQVAGYYQINGNIEVDGTSVTRCFCSIYKNGSEYKQGNDGVQTSAYKAVVSSLVYLNGSTDYVELYGWAQGSSLTFYNSSGKTTYFNGVLVRAA